MPPIRRQTVQTYPGQESRILLAIRGLNNQKISSICEAAKQYRLPRSTLQYRLHGKQYYTERRASNHKLTEIVEDSLEEWILDLDRWQPQTPKRPY